MDVKQIVPGAMSLASTESFSRVSTTTGHASVDQGGDWTTAYEASGTNSHSGGTLYDSEGSWWTSVSRWQISRAFVSFDTTGISSSDSILSAEIRVKIRTDMAPGETDSGYSTVHVVEGIQSDPIVDSDYGTHRTQTASGGSIPFSSLDGKQGEYVVIPLDSTGISWIVKEGTTKFCLRLAGEKDGTEPTGINRVWWELDTDGVELKVTLA